jgi:hypothetical protein
MGGGQHCHFGGMFLVRKAHPTMQTTFDVHVCPQMLLGAGELTLMTCRAGCAASNGHYDAIGHVAPSTCPHMAWTGRVGFAHH